MRQTIEYVASTGDYNYTYTTDLNYPDAIVLTNDHASSDITVQAINAEDDSFCTDAITVKAGEELSVTFVSFKKLYIRGTSTPFRLLIQRRI